MDVAPARQRAVVDGDAGTQDDVACLRGVPVGRRGGVHAQQQRVPALTDKDAGDVLRIMMITRARQVSETFTSLRDDPSVGDVATDGLEKVRQLFGGRATPGVDMAFLATATGVVPSLIRLACRAGRRVARHERVLRARRTEASRAAIRSSGGASSRGSAVWPPAASVSTSRLRAAA